MKMYNKFLVFVISFLMVIPVYAVDEIIERKVERISENFTSTFNYQHNCNLYNETLLQEKIENNDIIKSVVESLNVSCKKQIFFDNTVLFVNFLMFSYVMGSMIGIVLMSFGVGALRGRVPNNNLNNQVEAQPRVNERKQHQEPCRVPNNNLNNQVEAQPRVNERKQHQESVNVNNKKKNNKNDEDSMKSKLIYILSCLMFLNTLSFALFCGNSQRTRTPRPVCTTVAPFYTQIVLNVDDTDGKFNYKLKDKFWHDFFVSNQKVKGEEYFRAMKEKLFFRLTIDKAEVPEYILGNFHWLCALYDPDARAYLKCHVLRKNSDLECDLCIKNFYDNEYTVMGFLRMYL